MSRRAFKVVLTGAPGSGKTSIVAELARRHAGRLVVVPEAATQHYSSIGKRWDELDLDGRREAQRAIYRMQVAQEARLAAAHPDRLLLLDRGTIDGSAYWPDGPEAYWHDLGIDVAGEFARYDRVILLETAAAIGLYDGDASNDVRFESPEEAIESGHVLERLWAAHPDLHRVPAVPDIAEKVARVESIIGLPV